MALERDRKGRLGGFITAVGEPAEDLGVARGADGPRLEERLDVLVHGSVSFADHRPDLPVGPQSGR